MADGRQQMADESVCYLQSAVGALTRVGAKARPPRVLLPKSGSIPLGELEGAHLLLRGVRRFLLLLG